jgi:LacI family transcriptional regulator
VLKPLDNNLVATTCFGSNKGMDSYLAIYLPRNLSPGSEQVLRLVSQGVYEAAETLHCPYFIQHARIEIEVERSLSLMGVVGSERQRRLWCGLGIPVVNFSNQSGPLEGMANVLSDDEAVGRLAATHLEDRGYQQFLAIGQKGRQWSLERLKGFIGQMQERDRPISAVDIDMDINVDSITPDAYMEAIWEQVRPQLDSCPLDTGIFVSTDWIAWPLLNTLASKNPERQFTTGLLGVDNLHDHLFDPRRTAGLSSILPGFPAAGATGLRLILDALKDGRDIRNITERMSPDSLLERASTAGRACGDPVVAKLVREIWGGLRRGESLSLADLARENGLGLRSMELRFEKELGQSARTLLADMRIQLGRELLHDTDQPIAEISRRCGYANTTTFSNTFRKVEGMSPRDWRRKHTTP